MIVTLSPAKLLNFDIFEKDIKTTKPEYLINAQELNDILKNIDTHHLQKLMQINATLALDVFQFIYGFENKKTPEKSCVFAYNGIAYKGLDAQNMIAEDLMFAQEHLRIFSGMYGMLCPLDKIKPYRLEMQAKLHTERGNNLYGYWSDILTENMSNLLQKDDKVWINLMSDEYTKVVKTKNLPDGTQIITPIFKEYTNKGLRQIVVHTKRARGLFARFIIQNRLKQTDDLKAFDLDGYYYSEQDSTAQEWTFVR